ncbi:ATP-binding protein [bacterium]|nr:ATP-binding protein [bacterium]
MHTEKEILSIIQTGTESHAVEFKQSGDWNNYKYKIAKSAMAMANKEDGGVIIIGMARKRDGTYSPDGTEELQVKEYNGDVIQEFVNKYADPYVDLQLLSVEYDDKRFLAITIGEFDQIPVVCKKNYQPPKGNNPTDALNEGAVYIRSYRKPETCQVKSQNEMRDILYLATRKNTRRFLEASQRMGICPIGQQAAISQQSQDSSLFDDQLEGL